jgi:hypothetical protein
MAPTDRFVPRFAAEPPQEGLPYGRWAHSLSDAFYRASDGIDTEGEDLGEPDEITFYPDRTYAGRTYVPATATTSTGLELYGHVSFVPAPEGGEPSDVTAMADFTAQVTLIWGRPLRGAGAIVTAELADLAVDQCVLVEDRFTLIAPDDYRADTVEVKLFDARGREVARESLYEETDEEETDEEE